MRRLPSLAGLATFDAVARHMSFSKAGRALHVTQGAVSHRIRALEEEMGVVLFRRTSRRVGLTDHGSILFRATDEAFARLRRGLDELDAVSNPGRVTVSCSPSFAIRWLVPRLGDLREYAPAVDLHVSAEDDLVEPGTGGIDACIRFGPGAYRDVVAERLTAETITPVCAPHYAEREGITGLRNLESCTLLHDDVLADHVAHVGWREWLGEAGLTAAAADRGTHFSHSHLALEAAAAGQGIALGRRCLVEDHITRGVLVAPFDLSVNSRLNYWLLTVPGEENHAGLSSFREWLGGAIGGG